jgi:hypothetical protein
MAVAMSNPDSPVCESEIPAAAVLIARREKVIIDASKAPDFSLSPACAKLSTSKKKFTEPRGPQRGIVLHPREFERGGCVTHSEFICFLNAVERAVAADLAIQLLLQNDSPTRPRCRLPLARPPAGLPSTPIAPSTPPRLKTTLLDPIPPTPLSPTSTVSCTISLIQWNSPPWRVFPELARSAEARFRSSQLFEGTTAHCALSYRPFHSAPRQFLIRQ